LFCIFRTDPEAERHRGLTYFLVPLDAPGVTVRGFGRLDGEGLREVSSKRRAQSAILAVSPGWNVAMATASSERGVNLRSPGRFAAPAQRAVDLYQRLAVSRTRRPVICTPVAGPGGPRLDERRPIAGTRTRPAARLMSGGQMGPEASLMKIR
jgi:alkylation response protein AidB-like acyl-CoA dehydrogenase